MSGETYAAKISPRDRGTSGQTRCAGRQPKITPRQTCRDKEGQADRAIECPAWCKGPKTARGTGLAKAHCPGGSVGFAQGGVCHRCDQIRTRRGHSLPDYRSARGGSVMVIQAMTKATGPSGGQCRKTCEAQWLEVYGRPPPKHLSTRFMQRALGWEIQTKKGRLVLCNKTSAALHSQGKTG
jgi:hypothetical protein